MVPFQVNLQVSWISVFYGLSHSGIKAKQAVQKKKNKYMKPPPVQHWRIQYLKAYNLDKVFFYKYVFSCLEGGF